MKKSLLLFCFLTAVTISFGQEMVQFKISKPYCVFNFLEAATQKQGTSPTLSEYIASKTENDSLFKKLCADFSALQLNYTYHLPEFPTNRMSYRSTKDLLIIALVNASTIDEFEVNTRGILPNSEHQKLVNILEESIPYYDQLLWNQSEEKLHTQQKALEGYRLKSTEVFHKFKQFYRSSWTADLPFTVALYPIPGDRGRTTATPHANSLSVGVMTDETQPARRMSVVLHEMSHVLYNEQPVDFQHQMEQWFTKSKSAYAPYAYQFFNEGLATVLGNGWAFKYLSGSLDERDWYANEYINGFAKELYPLVDDYLTKNRPMDQEFIDQAIALFAQRFPNASTDYGVLFNTLSLYSDAESEGERAAIMQAIGEQFQFGHFRSSTPILEENNLALLKSKEHTQLIIIDRNHETTLNQLKTIFPQLADFNPENIPSMAIFSFYDQQNRPIVLLYSTEKNKLRELVHTIKTIQHFDLNKIIQN